MTDVTAVRQAIKAVIESIPDTGVVHDRERFLNSQSQLKALYVPPAADEVRGWFIGRRGVKRVPRAVGATTTTFTWTLRAYASFVDAASSEVAFDAMLDAVAQAFAAADDLGGACDTLTTDQAAGLQVDDAGPVMFAGVLCHAARMTLITRHFS